MAGAILISKNKALTTNSIDFDNLVERIRHSFPSEDQQFISEIYFPLDEGGMTFISLVDTSNEAFQAFVTATKLAYSKASTEDLFSKYQANWDELLKLLAEDPRSSND